MKTYYLCWALLLTASVPLACEDGLDGDELPGEVGPGSAATDARAPELGTDLSVLSAAKVSMSEGLSVAKSRQGPAIEAKFELGEGGKLSLSVYPIGKGMEIDAERNQFQELAGDPTKAPWMPSMEPFSDREHLVRSSRDLTLVQLSALSLEAAVEQASEGRFVYWAVPTIRDRRAGYGVYTRDAKGTLAYAFIDGAGPAKAEPTVVEIGEGPGSGATDARVPELGEDPTIVRTAKISLADGIRFATERHGTAVEAKFELGDDGKLSLSVYPLGKAVDMDAERNTFQELAGDPTAMPWAPAISPFAGDDAEHQTRSARDLTLVQTSALSLLDAVTRVQEKARAGVVVWAVPTMRDQRAGYGVYVLSPEGRLRYFFAG